MNFVYAVSQNSLFNFGYQGPRCGDEDGGVDGTYCIPVDKPGLFCLRDGVLSTGDKGKTTAALN